MPGLPADSLWSFATEPGANPSTSLGFIPARALRVQKTDDGHLGIPPVPHETSGLLLVFPRPGGGTRSRVDPLLLSRLHLDVVRVLWHAAAGIPRKFEQTCCRHVLPQSCEARRAEDSCRRPVRSLREPGQVSHRRRRPCPRSHRDLETVIRVSFEIRSRRREDNRGRGELVPGWRPRGGRAIVEDDGAFDGSFHALPGPAAARQRQSEQRYKSARPSGPGNADSSARTRLHYPRLICALMMYLRISSWESFPISSYFRPSAHFSLPFANASIQATRASPLIG